MIERLQIGVHITGISLINKPIMSIRICFLHPGIQIHKEIGVNLLELKPNYLSRLLTCAKFLPDFLNYLILILKPSQVHILSPEVDHARILRAVAVDLNVLFRADFFVGLCDWHLVRGRYL